MDIVRDAVASTANHSLLKKREPMTTADLRREIKKIIDQLPADRLASLADYAHFLDRPPLPQRLQAAEKAIKAGRGVPWRKVRREV